MDLHVQMEYIYKEIDERIADNQVFINLFGIKNYALSVSSAPNTVFRKFYL